VRRRRFEALLLAGAIFGSKQPAQAQPQGGGLETMMQWLG
jgi:hypothetical protein